MLKKAQGFAGQQTLVLPLVVTAELERNVLFRDLFIHSVGHFPNARHHYYERPNGCSEYILFYCYRGNGFYTVDDKKYDVTENQAFILPPNVPHSYGANPTWSIYWIHFKGCKAEYFLSALSKPVTITSPQENPVLLINALYDTLKSGYDSDNLMYACLVFGHILGLITHQTRYKWNTSNNELGTSLINWATYYMNENIHKNLQMEDLSEFTSFSPSHLHRLFHKATGYAPIQYFHHLKIEKACFYLEHTNYKINQIAKILGFRDAYYFSKIFTKIKKTSPSQFRKHSDICTP